MPTWNSEENPEYAKDLEEMLKQKDALKIRAYDFCESNLRSTPEQLKMMGFDSFQHLCEFSIREGSKDIAKLLKAHIRKYPD
jgi:hypothetical protein